MKNIFKLLVFIVLVAISCSKAIEEIPYNSIPLTDLSKFNLKILPVNPTAADEVKLVVYDDCNYNLLTGVKINGKVIDIEKQFNSLMMRPCLLQNDTILIGKLTVGIYTVNYKLKDISTSPKDKYSVAITFQLPISR